MKKGTRGEARIHVSASPEKLYDMVSDVTRIPEWSPECVSCRWIGGAAGPTVGARFKGTNKRSFIRWSTKPKVVAADPAREFAFETVTRGPSTRWTYRFEPTADGGTDLIESFEMLEDESAVLRFMERRVMGITDRQAHLERG